MTVVSHEKDTKWVRSLAVTIVIRGPPEVKDWTGSAAQNTVRSRSTEQKWYAARSGFNCPFICRCTLRLETTGEYGVQD